MQSIALFFTYPFNSYTLYLKSKKTFQLHTICIKLSIKNILFNYD